jgi:hypothetical protein
LYYGRDCESQDLELKVPEVVAGVDVVLISARPRRKFSDAFRVAPSRLPQDLQRSRFSTRVMTSLPPSLVADIRHAFRSCARQHLASRRTQFSTSQALLKKSKSTGENKNVQLEAQKKARAQSVLPPKPRQAASTDLIPHEQDGRALDHGRKVEVPMRVIPKADIAPDVELKPKERMAIEQLTRRPPPKVEPRGQQPPLCDFNSR